MKAVRSQAVVELLFRSPGFPQALVNSEGGGFPTVVGSLSIVQDASMLGKPRVSQHDAMLA